MSGGSNKCSKRCHSDYLGIIGKETIELGIALEKTDGSICKILLALGIVADPRSIYVIRDSFSSHMAMYIGSQFTDSILRYSQTYSYDDLIEYDPDIVVYETVERYVGELATFSIR